MRRTKNLQTAHMFIGTFISNCLSQGYSYSTDPSVTLVDVASITAHPGYTYSFANPMYQDDFAILTLAEVVASKNFKDRQNYCYGYSKFGDTKINGLKLVL